MASPISPLMQIEGGGVVGGGLNSAGIQRVYMSMRTRKNIEYMTNKTTYMYYLEYVYSFYRKYTS